MSLWSVGARTRASPTRPVPCAHCGLPAPAPILEAEPPPSASPALVFCCRTCRQVYDLARELRRALPFEKDLARAD